uniref:Zn(2)-C6 fungal-type domain-containing protein n=1 Tax=Kwoniella pini CBS 10737 TaxID=1296096 RepID=A0A1B9HUJ7_9TREE|nr:uncharacterized protein I206_06714 [Kwoniella pini CBS 10737]OCF46940.1 hypothetical protein I206_06714 [Kwoniella pini CBS 10737]
MPAHRTALPSTPLHRKPNHVRTYQACESCRAAKLRCDLGSPDAPHDPPCRRCLRTGRQCNFTRTYQRKTAKTDTLSHIHTPDVLIDPALGLEDDIHPHPEPSIQPSLPRHDNNDLGEFKFVRGERLENPADALRILCAAAEGEDSKAGDATNVSIDYTVGTGLWNQWVPVRDGLLTSDEATALLSYFGTHLNILLPIVPTQLFQPENFPILLREPLLLAAMICTASRYMDLGQSFNPSEPRRARIVQNKITHWLRERIGFIAMGETSSRTIGTVEALLILSEWPPRALLLSDNSINVALHPSKSPGNPCKVYDDLSWTMIGLAVRISQELGLHDEKAYPSEAQEEWSVHRRHRTWICGGPAVADPSFKPVKMPTGWWDVLGEYSRLSGDETFPFPRVQVKWKDIMLVAQLTHMIGLIQEQFYDSADVTAELIRTGRFETTLHRLKPELEMAWHIKAGDLPTYDLFNHQGASFSEDELRELRWRLDLDYIRLYSNAIAMRAAQARVMRRHSKRNQHDRVFQASVINSTEGPFIIEAVDAAVSLVKYGIALHKKAILRYCPSGVFLRLVFASVFLMKAVSFGAVGQPEQEIVDLQYALIQALSNASVDNEHVAGYLATMLSRVFPSIPTGPARAAPTEVNNTTDEIPNTDTTNILSLFGFDTEISPNPGYNSHLESLSGFGYDPRSIVSDIEEMLAVTEHFQFDLQQPML